MHVIGTRVDSFPCLGPRACGPRRVVTGAKHETDMNFRGRIRKRNESLGKCVVALEIATRDSIVLVPSDNMNGSVRRLRRRGLLRPCAALMIDSVGGRRNDLADFILNEIVDFVAPRSRSSAKTG